MTEKKYLLGEFQQQTGLSDSAIFSLLKNDNLPVVINENGQITIDPSSLDLEKIIEATLCSEEQVFEQTAPVLKERFRRIIGDHIERLFDEALSLYRNEKR